jgi:uncharacterized protein
METKEKLTMALRDAMRAGDDVSRRTIRMCIAAVKQWEIDNRKTMEEAGTIGVLQKEIKIRQEAVQDAIKANREDLVSDNRAEIQVIENFLPKQLTEDELSSEAQVVIDELHATSMNDMGKVIKILRPKLEGKASGEAISKVVRQLLLRS